MGSSVCVSMSVNKHGQQCVCVCVYGCEQAWAVVCVCVCVSMGMNKYGQQCVCVCVYGYEQAWAAVCVYV